MSVICQNIGLCLLAAGINHIQPWLINTLLHFAVMILLHSSSQLTAPRTGAKYGTLCNTGTVLVHEYWWLHCCCCCYFTQLCFQTLSQLVLPAGVARLVQNWCQFITNKFVSDSHSRRHGGPGLPPLLHEAATHHLFSPSPFFCQFRYNNFRIDSSR